MEYVCYFETFDLENKKTTSGLANPKYTKYPIVLPIDHITKQSNLKLSKSNFRFAFAEGSTKYFVFQIPRSGKLQNNNYATQVSFRILFFL